MTVETVMFLKGLLVGIVLGVGAVFAFLKYKMKFGGPKNRTIIAKVPNTSGSNFDCDDEIFAWLNIVLQSYKKEYTAYLLEIFRLKNHLKDNQVSGLQQIYGKSLDEAPSLRLNQKYVKKFSNWVKLSQAEKKWLQQRNVAIDDENHMADKIEEILIEDASKEAPRVFEIFCKENAIVIENR